MTTTPPPPVLLQSRLDTLDAWERESGLQVRLCPDTHAFQWKPGGLDYWQREHLREHKGEFAEALRLRAGLCIRCGDDLAKRPKGNPGLPPMWCSSCYERGAWENWASGIPMKGGPRANSQKQRDDDALFDGIDDDETDEATPEGLDLFDGPADGPGDSRSNGTYRFL